MPDTLKHCMSRFRRRDVLAPSHHLQTRANECEVTLYLGCTLRAPAYPLPCSYVRICDSLGNEIVYWDSAEWQEDPVEVMGAIVGAMKG